MPLSKTGWDEFTIGQLGRVITGKTPPTKRSELYGQVYPFITPSDIDNRNYVVRTERFLSEEGCRFQRNLLLPARSVCVVCIASIGKICMSTYPSFTNQQINSVVVLENQHDPFFVYYVLKNALPRLRAIAGGVATPISNKGIFSEMKLSVPPLPTQRKIAGILSAYDHLIENNTRRIAILEEMAQAIYREWFVHFRFPGHESVRMVESELGMIPEGWEVMKLGDVALVNAQSIKRGHLPVEIEYVNISSVSTGAVETTEKLKRDEAPGRARRIVQHGDIIWSCVRPNRRSYALIQSPSPHLIVSTGFAVITARSVPSTYLYHAVTTDSFVGYLTNHARGAAYPAVTAEDFEKADVLVASKPLLTRFDEIAADFYALKQVLLTKNTNLRQTRDLLLPRLVSGEVDVSELDVGVEGLWTADGAK